jgi:hypothetical protein
MSGVTRTSSKTRGMYTPTNRVASSRRLRASRSRVGPAERSTARNWCLASLTFGCAMVGKMTKVIRSASHAFLAFSPPGTCAAAVALRCGDDFVRRRETAANAQVPQHHLIVLCIVLNGGGRDPQLALLGELMERSILDVAASGRAGRLRVKGRQVGQGECAVPFCLEEAVGHTRANIRLHLHEEFAVPLEKFVVPPRALGFAA